LKLEDSRLVRLVAYKLFQEGFLDQAQYLFDSVVKMRGEEPQSHRDLALVLEEKGNYQEAVNTFYKIVTTQWPPRFAHIEDEVIMEMNRAIYLAKNAGKTVDTSDIDKRFLELFTPDIKLTIAWDTDDTCIDLFVTEPNGEVCNYGNHQTKLGGWSTPDYPGCNPTFSTAMLREYMIKKATAGTYKVACNYYSNSRQDLTGSSTIWFTLFTNYGTPTEKKKMTVLRLESNSTNPSSKSKYEIGTVEYK